MEILNDDNYKKCGGESVTVHVFLDPSQTQWLRGQALHQAVQVCI